MQLANKVALNTGIQYVRLILGVLISLYSVRLILRALGADDYGIYDVVAGVINLLGFMCASLSMTSTRFISVSLGKGIPDETRKTFKSCFSLHLIIALVLVLVLQFVFLFVFDGLNIPIDRIPSAKWIYQFMLLTLFLNVTVTPFTALVISHENFVFVSLVGIVDSILKLVVAIVISSYHADRLVLYGALMAAIAVFDVICYVFFCLLKYRRDMSVGVSSIGEMKAVSGFAGWTLLDVLGSVIPRQGYAVLLNKFFGTSVNTVFALARQVEGPLSSLSASVIDSMKPQIMKSYGQGDESRMLRLSTLAGKAGVCMMSIVSIPLLVMTPEILRWWLGDFPQDTILYTRLLVLACMANQLTMGLFYANQATGDIKWFSIIIASLRILALPVSLLFFLCGYDAYVAIVVFVVCESMASICRVIIISKRTSLNFWEYFKEILFRILPPMVIAMFVCYLIYPFSHHLLGAIINCCVTASLYLVLSYFISLMSNERVLVNGVIQTVLKKIFKR